MARVNAEDLYPVLDKVQDWPASASQLHEAAEDSGADENVSEFFEMIPEDTVFENEGEVISMAHQLEADETEEL